MIPEWNNKCAKTSSTVIRSRGDSILAKNRLIVDYYDKSAKELWNELIRIFTQSSAQAITKLPKKLNGPFLMRISPEMATLFDFMSPIDQLDAFDRTAYEADKK